MYLDHKSQASVCLPVPRVQISFFPAWFLRHFRWSYISETQHTHKSLSTSPQKIRIWSHGFKIPQQFFWDYSKLHKSQMESWNKNWKWEECFAKLHSTELMTVKNMPGETMFHCHPRMQYSVSASEPGQRSQIQLAVSNFSCQLRDTCRHKTQGNLRSSYIHP